MLAYGCSMRRLVSALACLALLAACDDGESIDPEADEERIEAALLTIDDLPDDFVEGEPSEDDEGSNECNEDVLDIEEDAIDDVRTAETDQVSFENETTEVEAQIEAFRDTELPRRVLDAIGDDDDYLDCLEDAIVEELEDVELDGFEEIDSPVDDGRALELRATFGDVPVVSQQHAVLVDRFGVTLQVTSVDGEIDEDLVEDALDAMVERLGVD